MVNVDKQWSHYLFVFVEVGRSLYYVVKSKKQVDDVASLTVKGLPSGEEKDGEMSFWAWSTGQRVHQTESVVEHPFESVFCVQREGAMLVAENHNCTAKECLMVATTEAPVAVTRPWLETDAMAGFRVWHIIFLSIAGLISVVIVVCCCVRIRIPRTKQEIEADYIRKKITRKFEKQLRMIHNADMDEMDLKRALDRVRAEFKSDTESLAQSDALSGATLSSENFNGQVHDCGSYRKASDIGISFDDLLEKQQQQAGARKFPSIAGMIAKFRAPKRPIPVLE